MVNKCAILKNTLLGTALSLITIWLFCVGIAPLSKATFEALLVKKLATRGVALRGENCSLHSESGHLSWSCERLGLKHPRSTVLAQDFRLSTTVAPALLFRPTKQSYTISVKSMATSLDFTHKHRAIAAKKSSTIPPTIPNLSLNIEYTHVRVRSQFGEHIFTLRALHGNLSKALSMLEGSASTQGFAFWPTALSSTLQHLRVKFELSVLAWQKLAAVRLEFVPRLQWERHALGVELPAMSLLLGDLRSLGLHAVTLHQAQFSLPPGYLEHSKKSTKYRPLSKQTPKNRASQYLRQFGHVLGKLLHVASPYTEYAHKLKPLVLEHASIILPKSTHKIDLEELAVDFRNIVIDDTHLFALVSYGHQDLLLQFHTTPQSESTPGKDANFPAKDWGLSLRFSQLSVDTILQLLQIDPRGLEQAQLDLDLRAEYSAPVFSAHIQSKFRNVVFRNARLSPLPLELQILELRGELEYNEQRDALWSRNAQIIYKPLIIDASLRLDNLHTRAVMRLNLQAQDLACSDIPKVIPRAFRPSITELAFSGNTMRPKISVVYAPGDPGTFGLQEEGFSASGCSPTTLSPYEIEALNRDDYTFLRREYTTLDQGVLLGPGTTNYVGFFKIPVYVQRAVLNSEDGGFFIHGPLRTDYIEGAIRQNLEHGRFVYGGSTISQQLVKNLFLKRDKTLARKFEEALIAWKLEVNVPKTRIFELYLNMIEFGPDIYGIKMAAKFYFDKQPQELSPLEGAFIASLKTAPSKGATYYLRGFPKYRDWDNKLQIIMAMLRDCGYISAADYEAAAPYVPEFVYPGKKTASSDFRVQWLKQRKGTHLMQ